MPTFEKMINGSSIETTAEVEYDKLEPWIQWPSIHTGKNFDEHGVFRLGDIKSTTHLQIFEMLEQKGFRVGAISPMNAVNRLVSPAYFIPDPWTKTSSDGSRMSEATTQALVQAVNDNASGRITARTALALVLVALSKIRVTALLAMFVFALTVFRKRWRKALVLDVFLFRLHQTLMRRRTRLFLHLLNAVPIYNIITL